MTSAESLKRLTALLAKLRSAPISGGEDHSTTHAVAVDSDPLTTKALATCSSWNDPVLTELIRSILIENSTLDSANSTLVELCANLVDVNELRVCLSAEVAAMLKPNCPEPATRAASIRAALGEIFRREHGVSLTRLVGTAKREATEYITSMPGISPFAAARTLLLALDVHAMPVDAALATRLCAAGVVDKTATPVEVAAILTKAVRPGEGPAACQLLRTWSDLGTKPARPAAKQRREAAPRRRPSRGKSKAT